MDKKDLQYDWFAFKPDHYFFTLMELGDLQVGRFFRLLMTQWKLGSVDSKLTGMDDIITVKGEIVSIENANCGSNNGSNSGSNRSSNNGTSSVEALLETNLNSEIKIRVNREALWNSIVHLFKSLENGRFIYEELETERQVVKEKIENQERIKEINSRKGKSSAEKRAQKANTGSTADATPVRTTVETAVETTAPTPAEPLLQPIRLDYSINKKEVYAGTDKEKIKKIVNTKDILKTVKWDKRPAEFVEFALDYWASEVATMKESTWTEDGLRKNFVQTVRMRLNEIERAFIGETRNVNWFEQELNRVVKKNADPDAVKQFRDYYLTSLPTGSYYFQTLSNFDMGKLLADHLDKWTKKKKSRLDHERIQPVIDSARLTEEQQLRHYSGGGI